MKAWVILLGLALAAAAPQGAGDVAEVENSIREGLSSQGEVVQVEMSQRDAGSMAGFAAVRLPNGNIGRLSCTARRNDAGLYDWRCLPVITAQELRDVEAVIRSNLSSQGEVLQAELRRVDDNRMSGFARLRVGSRDYRLTCTAVRASEESNQFNWECQPDG